MDKIKEIIEKLELIPLEGEGGLFKRTYFKEEGETASAIYYMLVDGSFSHLHKLDADEMYHFYLGDSVELLELFPDGTSKITCLGTDIIGGEEVQHLVKKDVWQGSRLKNPSGFALMGTTMAPAYTQEGYVHGNKDELIKKFPLVKEEILKLCN